MNLINKLERNNMELREVFRIIKRKYWLIILILIIMVGSTVYFSVNQKDKYETSTIITVQADKEKTEQYQYGGYYAIQASDFFVNTIEGWIKSPNFVAEIYKSSGIEFDHTKIKKLGRNIYSQKVPPQNLVLSVTDETREQSRNISDNIINLIKQKTNKLNLVANAAANFEIINSEPITIPIKPNLIFNLLVSVITALVISLLIIFIGEYLSPTINNLQRVKNIFKKTPISLRGIKTKGLANQESKEAEKFRFIRANIAGNENNQKETLIVAGFGEKTNTPIISANLALSYARSGKKTVLVDANFVNPNIHEFFGKSNEFGFSELLFDEKNIEKYLQKTDEVNLKIISAGIKLAYASDTIERSDLEKVFKEIEKESDVVIINVPSLNSSSEAYPLFSLIKKVLLVIRLGKTNLSAATYINTFLDKKEVEKYIIVI